MANDAMMSAAGHPAPHRERIGLTLLFFGLLAGPVAWSLQLMVNYGLASHACFPSRVPQATVSPGLEWVWPALLVINIVAVIVAAGSAAVSFRNLRLTRQEAAGGHGGLLEAGEGRTRFLSAWGLLTSLIFAVAALFNTIGVLGLPLCGS